MPQRSLVCLILVCSFLMVTAGPVAAARTFAVAPFKIHAPEKYQYLSHGIPSMITSRLSSGTSLRVSEKPVLSEARELSRDKAREILAQADLEYLVYGSVTVMQEQSSLSLKVLSGEDKLITRTSQMPLDKLIPRVDTMVGEIKQELGLAAEAPAGSGEQAKVSGGETRAETSPEKATEQKKLNARFEEKEKVQRKEGEDKINPQFEHAKKEQRETGRWQSPELSFPAHGMRVGDADGDAAGVVRPDRRGGDGGRLRHARRHPRVARRWGTITGCAGPTPRRRASDCRNGGWDGGTKRAQTPPTADADEAPVTDGGFSARKGAETPGKSPSLVLSKGLCRSPP